MRTVSGGCVVSDTGSWSLDAECRSVEKQCRGVGGLLSSTGIAGICRRLCTDGGCSAGRHRIADKALTVAVQTKGHRYDPQHGARGSDCPDHPAPPTIPVAVSLLVWSSSVYLAEQGGRPPKLLDCSTSRHSIPLSRQGDDTDALAFFACALSIWQW